MNSNLILNALIVSTHTCWHVSPFCTVNYTVPIDVPHHWANQ